jgi:hypothetical protein
MLGRTGFVLLKGALADILHIIIPVKIRRGLELKHGFCHC